MIIIIKKDKSIAFGKEIIDFKCVSIISARDFFSLKKKKVDEIYVTIF